MSNDAPIDEFREFLLSKKKMRLTPERETLVTAVFASDDQFDADQWFVSLRDGNGAILASRSTVYRTLNLLVEAGLIRKIAREDGHEVYEHD